MTEKGGVTRGREVRKTFSAVTDNRWEESVGRGRGCAHKRNNKQNSKQSFIVNKL
jgi:hypothetical protein